MATEIIKYPKTVHLKDYTNNLEGEYVVVEEKMDGSQVGISFTDDNLPIYQTRGKVIDSSNAEFSLLRSWVNVHKNALLEVLGKRYVMFGEWMLIKHTVFYDMLPHYFMEFDVLDKNTGNYLSTLERQQLLRDLPVVSVAVIWNGIVDDIEQVNTLIGKSLFKSNTWKTVLTDEVKKIDGDLDRVFRETDNSDLMEGLYIKVENNGIVKNRIKLVRPDFISTIVESDSHWTDRNAISNKIRGDVNIWR